MRFKKIFSERFLKRPGYDYATQKYPAFLEISYTYPPCQLSDEMARLFFARQQALRYCEPVEASPYFQILAEGAL